MLAEIQPPPPGRSWTLADQAKALAIVLREEFGIGFRFFDAQTGALVRGESSRFEPDPPGLGPDEVKALAETGRARVAPLPDGGYQVALLLYQGRRPVLVAVGALGALARTPADAGRERAMLQGWLQAVSDRLRLTEQVAVRRRQEEEQGTHGTLPWEALLALDQVTRRLRFNKQPDKSLQRILEAARNALGAQALLWVPEHPDSPVLMEGKGGLAPADCRQLAAVLAKTPDFRAPGPLWCEQVSAKPWGSRFPSLVNLMAFQAIDQTPLGWVIALNKTRDEGRRGRAKDEGTGAAPAGGAFRRSDAALLTPFVALLEMYVRGSNRYQELKDLLVGLTRSLTTALDAKDSYTFGHSERVARIAVELGREMGLEGDELGDIYLAGLLHDVGKIGIRDTVLLKPGPLTPEEREHIKQHVTIGYSILAELRQIRNLLPGVLYHHERYDGTGYPDGLAGENIPLMARILAVADAYDAMSNARPYRSAMPCRKVEEILVAGMGTQWDRQVVEAFLRCRQRVHTIRQRGVGDSLRLAIEGTLRNDSDVMRDMLSLEPLP